MKRISFIIGVLLFCFFLYLFAKKDWVFVFVFFLSIAFFINSTQDNDE